MTSTSPRVSIPAGAWRTSSYSAANNECVEVGPAGGWVGLRDSTRPHAAVLTVPTESFAAMVGALRTGQL
ncbi:DUF397 domain-containing protein [Streptomyces parvus]|uniref:DUF397 domain-containing protein n=1 Tax=Streptomyces parvus TaxID=66428 RepID=UPI0036CD5F90